MTDAPRELDLIDATAGEEAAAARAEERRQAAVHLVNALFRLVRVLGIHTETNQAVLSLVDGMVTAVGAYCEIAASGAASVLFAEDTVFVNGQMLRASRDTYATAIKLGQYYERCGISEITFDRGVTAPQVSALARATHHAMQGGGAADGLLEANIGGVRLRKIRGSATQGDGAREETATERVVRTYATSIVVLRQFYADLRSGDLSPPRRIKRVAQKLVSSADEEARILLALTGSRAAEADRAGLAVNSAILAVLMARGLTSDRAVLAGIATAALLYDVGEPRLTGRSELRSGVQRRLSDDELDRLPASTAAVLTALGRIQTRTIASTVAGWETQWLQRAQRLGPPYGGRRPPTLLARILATARAFTELVGRTAGAAAPAVDDIVQLLTDRAGEESERAVVRLLVAALGLFPLGTTIELTTGELAIVIGVPDVPLNYSRPRVKLLSDADGNLVEGGADVDLSAPPVPGQPPRSVRRVVESDAQQLKEMRSYVMAIVGGKKASPPAPREVPQPPREAQPPRESSPSRASIPPARVSRPQLDAGRYSSVPSDAVHAPRTSAPTRQVRLEDYAQQADLAGRGSVPPAQAQASPTAPPARSRPAAAPTRQVSWEDYPVNPEELRRPSAPPAQARPTAPPARSRPAAAPTRQVSWEDYPVNPEELRRPSAPPAAKAPAPPPSKAAPAPTARLNWENYKDAFAAVQASRRSDAGDPRDSVVGVEGQTPAAPERKTAVPVQMVAVPVPKTAAPAPIAPEEKKKAPRTRMVRWANTEALFDDLDAEDKTKRGGPKDGK